MTDAMNSTSSRNRGLILLSLSAALAWAPAQLEAQNRPDGSAVTGRIVGRIVSTQTGEFLSSAQVYIQASGKGAISSLDGRFNIRGVPAGTHDVTVDLLGYGTKTVRGVSVSGGQTVSLDISLEPQAVALDAIEVEVATERGSTRALLSERRRSAVVVDAIGQDQIARSPDGDAAAALKRVPGLSVVDGKYAYVRGLGERYSSTTLNGAPLASPVPDKKVIPLDVIPSNLLESVVTAKSYSPDQPGDFAGGLVQLRTKDFPPFRTWNVSVSTGFNTVASLEDGLDYSGGGLDFLGFDDGTRDLPDAIPSDRRLTFGAGFSREDLAEIGKTVSGQWAPTQASLPVNESFGISFGDEFFVADRSLGFLGSFSQSSKYGKKDGLIERVFARSGLEEPEVDYAGEITTHSVSVGGLLNLAYELSPSDKITFNGVYNRLTDDISRSLQGFNLDANTDQLNTRIQYLARSLTNAQLSGEHMFESVGDALLEWRGAYTRAARFEPNTREVLYQRDPNTGEFIYENFIQSGSIFHQDMVDEGGSGGASLSIPFTFRDLPATLSVGGSLDRKSRDAFTRRFRFLLTPGANIDRTLPPNQLITAENIRPDGLELTEATFRTDNYTAEENLEAGYVMIDAEIMPRLRLVGGARVERSEQIVDPRDLFGLSASVEDVPGAELTRTRWLPSANLTFELTDHMNLRGSASRTLGRPQLRELAPFAFADYAGGYLVVGNPELGMTRISNFDLRWEWFFQPGALVAVSGFMKQFDDPIEVITLPSSELIRTWVNAGEADNIGTEIEFRSGPLGFIAEPLEPFSVNANLTLVSSEVNTGGVARVFVPGTGPTELQVVDKNRPLMGQSDHVVNLALAYTSGERNTRATVLFNRFGERIDAVGGQATPDIIEEGRNTLDLVLEQRFLDRLKVKFSASRLLGNEVEFTQGGERLRFYDQGRSFSLSLSWGT